jgi:hypothetical protein
MKTQLLCTFTPANKLRLIVNNIIDNYTIVYDKVFVLANLDDKREYMCTYNVYKDEVNGLMDYTISLHRKKETNTLYTINALNELIKLINNGVLDTSYQINWENYSNTMLTTNEDGVKKIPTKIKEVVYIKTKV